jgi:hypothetical protein
LFTATIDAKPFGRRRTTPGALSARHGADDVQSRERTPTVIDVTANPKRLLSTMLPVFKTRSLNLNR